MWQNSCSVDMEIGRVIALCYMYTIVPVPYRYSTGSRGSVPVSAPTQAVRAVRGRVLEPSVLVETLIDTMRSLKEFYLVTIHI